MRNILRKPSPAMVVACIALAVALSGTSWAVTTQLRPRSVGNEQLRTAAVNSRVLRNFSIRAVDIVPGVFRRGPRGRVGPPGLAGPAGPAGATGATGAAGVIAAITVRTASVTIPGTPGPNAAYATRQVSRNCDSGEKAISAGTGWSDQNNDLELTTVQILPVTSGGTVIGYVARGGNDSGQSSTFTLHVLCYK